MQLEIVRVEAHRIDERSLKITLRQRPGRLSRWIGRRESEETYHGYPGHWYVEQTYQPATKPIARFLDRVAVGPEFRHLRPSRQAKLP